MPAGHVHVPAEYRYVGGEAAENARGNVFPAWHARAVEPEDTAVALGGNSRRWPLSASVPKENQWRTRGISRVGGNLEDWQDLHNRTTAVYRNGKSSATLKLGDACCSRLIEASRAAPAPAPPQCWAREIATRLLAKVGSSLAKVDVSKGFKLLLHSSAHLQRHQRVLRALGFEREGTWLTGRFRSRYDIIQIPAHRHVSFPVSTLGRLAKSGSGPAALIARNLSLIPLCFATAACSALAVQGMHIVRSSIRNCAPPPIGPRLANGCSKGSVMTAQLQRSQLLGSDS